MILIVIREKDAPLIPASTGVVSPDAFLATYMAMHSISDDDKDAPFARIMDAFKDAF